MPRKIIRDFNEFIDECKMLPDITRERIIQPRNALEAHFFEVADKHGVLDAALDEYNGDGQDYDL
jgi:hypothetical protein